MVDIFSLPFILTYAALLGVCMKLADLFDEHSMHWFEGDALLFGFLWGFFGSLLVLSGNNVANVVLAMNLAYLIRMRLDYRNHAIAAVMIIITFLLKSSFNIGLFSIFFTVFFIFGSLRDYFGDKMKDDLLFKMNELALYYFIPTFIYSLFTKDWMIFFVFGIYRFFYNLVKYLLFYFKTYQKF